MICQQLLLYHYIFCIITHNFVLKATEQAPYLRFQLQMCLHNASLSANYSCGEACTHDNLSNSKDAEMSSALNRIVCSCCCAMQVLNADVKPRSYWQVVADARAVSLQVSITVASVEVFLMLQRGVPVAAILVAVVAIVGAGQLLIWALSGRLKPLPFLAVPAE